MVFGLLLTLSACRDSDDATGEQTTSDFSLVPATTNVTLTEGDGDGVTVPLTLVRNDDYSGEVTLELRGETDADTTNLTADFSPQVLSDNDSDSSLRLELAIADAPILPQTRHFYLIADDNGNRHQLPLTIEVTPVQRPDVYLLAGQSNMIGFSGDGTKQAGPGQADEPHDRILQLNVTENSEANFPNALAYTALSNNVAGDAPYLVRAEDPLHVPLDTAIGSKSLQYIGLGLSFAKAALPNTTQDIILVPAAWSGSSFCASPDGPFGNWNALDGDNSALGNTLLYERALTRTDIALEQSGGILRGILWHQGESDANGACAPLYQSNLEALMTALRSNIRADARGAEARGPAAPIPVVVGTMSRGSDERGDFSTFSDAKQIIDDVHNSAGDWLDYASVSNHDDLLPANGYPCQRSTPDHAGGSNESCLHFGPEALREMGRRYHSALREALLNPPGS
ncbi:MAG: hypothetical protein CSB44_03955 [Gammaproteobacteria bacterium]|nr:MAG: hypothetical protein CSB44_03955 [Gammaproteobacteria bacterium]